jgi:hypothetical protein
MRKSALGHRLICHELGHVLDFNLLPRLALPKKSTEESDLNPLGGSAFGRAMIRPNANAL